MPETMAHGIRLVQSRANRQQLGELLDAVGDGSLTLPVSTLPFTQTVEAHRRLDAKHSTGKLVLDLSDNPWLPTTTQEN